MLSQSELIKNPSRTRLDFIPDKKSKPTYWHYFSRVYTFLIPNCILRCCGMKTSEVRQAWREKVTLCGLICLSCCLLAFLTYGMNFFVCRANNQYVFSKLYRANFDGGISIARGGIYYSDDGEDFRENMSHEYKLKSVACKSVFGRQINAGTRNLPNERIADIYWEWSDITNRKFIVIDNKVYDPNGCTEEIYDELMKHLGTEWKPTGLSSEELECFKDSYYAGLIATKSNGCLLADTILYLSTVAIFGLIIVRFFLAIFYSWYLRCKKIKTKGVTPCILLVTCYSEGREGLKNTLDSLCRQEYNYNYKLIVVIADGEITGSGNDKSTPEILLDLADVSRNAEPKSYIALTSGSKRHNRACVYSGYYRVNQENEDDSSKKNKNEGEDNSDSKDNNITRILIINKCGNPAEQVKPGNRGKRDSQVILMSFFSKLLYNDRMSELDFEIYRKIKTLMPHLEPEDFECMLMVDADTIVKPNALSQMVGVFETDPKVIGICGETKILNKCESWVTMIQVFEYYISHHLSKSFESVFGGVTCLPGCFCMYRLKIVTNERGDIISGCTKTNRGGIAAVYSNRGDTNRRLCVPILANPFIINAYSVFEAKTLHEKNLLHLGEDRYLTTLLLKTFYKRKLVFIPSAQCETYVPCSFGILLSQRRRWINSTIHNLFELVQVNKLCGTFCCSMKFVVIMELMGTLVLPAAIIFTGVLILSSILIEPALIPLIMLVGIFGLPGVLILLTTWEITYLFWLVVYIFSIPLWNFVLPVYAFWHFDDFSWGETRKVTSEGQETEEGEFDRSKVPLREMEDIGNDVMEA